MRTLHVAPDQSAGGSLRQAIREAGWDDKVLSFRDDLSCGPIDSDDPAARIAWWAQFYEDDEADEAFGTFWDRAAACEDRIVVWFARHSARELAFFLAFADRLGERSYHIVDVTEAPAVSIVPPHGLRLLLGTERPITANEREVSRRQWRRLRSENAPFRIVTSAGLESAPIDHFDPLLLQCATARWQKIARVVGEAMTRNSEPYFQIGDFMLLTRIVALVGEGKLLAQGDLWKMRFCEVRLPD